MSEGPAARRSPARAAANMGAATAVSRGIGFARILVIAAVLGTTYLGNTYQSSNSVSNVLFELLAAGALSAVLVPTFTTMLDRGEQAEAERLAGGLLGLALLAMGAVAVVGVLAAPWIAQILTSGVRNPEIAAQQEALSTFLLRFVIPQVVLYAWGAVSVAVLFARRRFTVPAMAPIGLTVVVVAAMLLFRVLVGPGEPTLDLTLAEKLCLALGATLGVLAFVGAPAIALARDGFRLRPHIPRRDPAVRRLLGLSGWAVFQHSAAAILLAVALVVGNAVKGGVVAYNVAFTFFLAPYAVLAQPIHTAILPEMSGEADRGDLHAFGRSLRWALASMAVLVLPISAAMAALSLPGMRIVAFGNASSTSSIELLAAAMASLAIGLLPYSAFLLLARASYALGNSRLPAIVAMLSAAFGCAVMAAGSPLMHGTARVALLGIGNTAAYVVGSIWLGLVLRRRTGQGLLSAPVWRSLVLSVVLGLAAWGVVEAIDPQRRIGSLVVVLGVAAVGGAAYVAGLRLLGGGTVSRVEPPPAPHVEDADAGPVPG